MFEYKVVHNYIDNLEMVLNFYAKEGWKLDQVVFIPSEDRFRHSMVFLDNDKRPTYIVLVREAKDGSPT